MDLSTSLLDLASSAADEHAALSQYYSSISSLSLVQHKTLQAWCKTHAEFLSSLQRASWDQLRPLWRLDSVLGREAHVTRVSLVTEILKAVHEVLHVYGLNGAVEAECFGSDGFESDIDLTFVPRPGYALRTALLARFVFDSFFYGLLGGRPERLFDIQSFLPHAGALGSIEGVLETDSARQKRVRLELDAFALKACRVLPEAICNDLCSTLSRKVPEQVSIAVRESFSAARDYHRASKPTSPQRLVLLCTRIDALRDALSDDDCLHRQRAHLELTSSFPGGYLTQGSCAFVIEAGLGQKKQREVEEILQREQSRRRQSLPIPPTEIRADGRKRSLDSLRDRMRDGPMNVSPRETSPRSSIISSTQECAFAMLENWVEYFALIEADRSGADCLGRSIASSKYAERALLAAQQLTRKLPQLERVAFEVSWLLMCFADLETIKRGRRITVSAAVQILSDHLRCDCEPPLIDARPLRPYGKYGEYHNQQPADTYVVLLSKLVVYLREQHIPLTPRIIERSCATADDPDAVPQAEPGIVHKVLQALCGLPADEYQLHEILAEGDRIGRRAFCGDRIFSLNMHLERVAIRIFRILFGIGLIPMPDSSRRPLFDP